MPDDDFCKGVHNGCTGYHGPRSCDVAQAFLNDDGTDIEYWFCGYPTGHADDGHGHWRL